MNIHEMIHHMMKFTEAHAREAQSDPCLREAACNDVQLEYVMLPPRPEDLLAGRKQELPIGFLPQAGHSQVGYYCTRHVLEAMKSGAAPDEAARLDDLLQYWQGKTTKEKIIARYSAEMREQLTLGDMAKESGIGFPLYRMSGAQMDPTKLLTLGIDGLMAEAIGKEHLNPPFYQAVRMALESLQRLCIRYGDMVRDGKASGKVDPALRHMMAENLYHIAVRPPETFWQAMQLSYLFYLVSGTFNYGRMDEYLGTYYCRDIDSGAITEDFALALTKNLWGLMIERGTTWDARVILGGRDRRNIADADRFALAAIRASHEVRDVLPQLTLRCYQGMDTRVYDAALRAIGDGVTYPMLYNDEVNVPAAANAFSVSEAVAARYVPFGCGEYVLYNQSFGTPSGAINVLHALNEMLYGDAGTLADYADFESLYCAYVGRLEEIILLLARQEKLEYEVCAEDAPYLYFSILFDDCMARGKPIFAGGIRYLGGTLETYGNTNAADSLCAIKTMVYDRRAISPQQLAEALRRNFAGDEALRRLLLAAPKYGNDDGAVDALAVRFHQDLCRSIRACADKVGLDTYLGVVINNSMNTTFGLTTGASADGRLAATFMANANNPTGGMDKSGITALLNSLVKLRPDEHAGAVQNMRFSREMFSPGLLDKTKGLLAAYFQQGGAQTMITVLGRGDLEDAMVHPEAYQNLIVRVGGFSARFVELEHTVQQELLSRTLY